MIEHLRTPQLGVLYNAGIAQIALDFFGTGSGGGRRQPETAMAKTRPPNAHVIALLGVAIAILAEDMNTTGTQAPPKSANKRRVMTARLACLARDAQILAAAADVLSRRPELKL